METTTAVNYMHMPVDEAKRILGKEDDFFKLYQLKLWVDQENNELTPERKHLLAAAMRTLNQQQVIDQINQTGKFDLNLQITDLENVVKCDACHGAGEIMKFIKKPISVTCLKCKDVVVDISHLKTLDGKTLVINGDIITLDGKDVSDNPDAKKFLGKVVEDCLSCGGTGRYRKKLEDGLIVNVECKTCKGRHLNNQSQHTQIITKCKTCRGKRTVKIPVITSQIKSTTICRKCDGMGFLPKTPEKEKWNPVLSKDLGEMIKEM